jgi:GMP synthase-like glutamine amidotransferase
MQPVWIFRHIECEGPGFFEEVLSRFQIPHKLFAIDQRCRIPSNIDGASALVFMGGPMSVNDDDDWIEQELELIRQAQAQNLPMLGHCLGGQLISKALGASVYPNKTKEIGWLPVQRTNSITGHEWLESLQTEFEAFHWHGETFDLPDGAIPILQSQYCQNQAYLLGRTLAFQCHIEVTAEMVREWIDYYPEEISKPSASVQNADQMAHDIEKRCQRLHNIAEIFYRYWLARGELLEKVH